MTPPIREQRLNPVVVGFGTLACGVVFVLGCRLIYLGLTTESGFVSVGFGLACTCFCGYNIAKLIVMLEQRRSEREPHSAAVSSSKESGALPSGPLGKRPPDA